MVINKKSKHPKVKRIGLMLNKYKAIKVASQKNWFWKFVYSLKKRWLCSGLNLYFTKLSIR